jgi:hypothetical protein
MPLMTRRSSARSTPRTSVGKCGSIRSHCSSLSQNRFLRTARSPKKTNHAVWNQDCHGFAAELMSSDPSIPAIYPYDFFAHDGGLLSYGIDAVDVYRQAATYVDRILRGTRPSDLPVQAPVKFTLVVNIKTAKALGLSVPVTLQVAADEVIE